MRTLRLLFMLLAMLLINTVGFSQDSLAFGIEENQPLSIETKVEEVVMGPIMPKFNKDSIMNEVVDILSLLEAKEKKEMVITARSQEKLNPETEMRWILSQLDEKTNRLCIEND